MTKHQRECANLCRTEGLNIVKIEQRGKHWAIICVEGKLVCARTPSDHRTRHNLKSLAEATSPQKAA